MSNKQSDNLSGYWTGVYDYPRALREAVPFNAVITDSGGALSGEIIEPNTFPGVVDHELFASLSGARDGMTVSFVKTYEKSVRDKPPVMYEGSLDPTFTRIEGQWRITGQWSGPFVMNRSTGHQASQKDEAAQERDLVKTS